MADPNQPTLLDPTYYQKVYGNIIILTFTIPSDLDGDTLIFKAEVDTSNPISSLSSDYRSYESRFSQDRDYGHGVWQVENGSCWDSAITFPNSAAGSIGRVILTEKHAVDYPDVSGDYYYQILVSDQLVECPKFNTVKFGQAFFCSSV